MKKLIIIFYLASCIDTNAQNNKCNLLDNQLHNVFVFSQNRSHSVMELVGIHSSLTINIQYIPSETSKCEIDSLVLKNAMMDGVFIFPDKDESKTMRFCTPAEYASALRTKRELKIEKQ